MIVGLFTEMLSAGGVQRAGRETAAVLARFAADRGLACRFISLNDARGLHIVRAGPAEFPVSGYDRNKTQFVLAALRAAGRKPQLVVAMHPHLAPIVDVMRIRSRKFRSIVFAHGIEVWRPLSWPRGPALRRADLVIAPSKYTAQSLILQQGISPGRVQQLAWGLDPEFEERLRASERPARPAVFPEDARIILTVGRWDPVERYKGADTLISALPQVLRTIPDAFLVLVGDGGDRPRLEQLAREHGVANRTHFLYGLSQEELFACYAHCDLFALPSKGEGFGLVFLEAMAHGKPVIGGAHGGTPDVIQSGETGYLVNHGDITSLSRAIESLLADPTRSNEMGARGRERVSAVYTSDAFQSRLRQTLERFIPRQL